MLSRVVVVSLTLTLSFAATPVALNDAEIKAFVSTHNSVRAAVGVNTMLVWNTTLATFVENQASNCVFAHSISNYGENLYASWPTNTNHQALAVETVMDWASEKQLVDLPDWNCIWSFKCGHYSQVVWKATTAVGCSIVHCPNIDNLVTCEYWPRGNFYKQKPY